MPNPQVPQQTIRFASDISKWMANLSSTPNDLESNLPIQIANGSDILIQWLASDGVLADGTVVDFTNIDHVVFALQGSSNPHNSTTYWSYSVPFSNITNAVSAANWNNGSAQQISLAIPNSANSIGLLNNGSQAFWLCIYGVTKDATPKQVPYAVFPITVVDTGIPIANPALPQTFKIGSKIPFLCSDGLTRDVTLQKVGSLWTLNVNQTGYNGAGQAIYSLFCPTPGDNLYRDLSLIEVSGVWNLNIGQTGHS
jgi:hypothetical protein